MIQLAPIASNAMLDALAALMDGGTIELSSDQRVLAVLQLSTPAAMPATDGALEFNKIAIEDAALASGTVTSASIIGSDGNELLRCNVGDLNSDAVIKLDKTKIELGGPIWLKSFRLTL